MEIWTDLVEASGFYLYLEQKSKDYNYQNLSGQLRKGIHQSTNLCGKFFHDEQVELLTLLNADRNIIGSAPTSE